MRFDFYINFYIDLITHSRIINVIILKKKVFLSSKYKMLCFPEQDAGMKFSSRGLRMNTTLHTHPDVTPWHFSRCALVHFEYRDIDIR